MARYDWLALTEVECCALFTIDTGRNTVPKINVCISRSRKRTVRLTGVFEILNEGSCFTISSDESLSEEAGDE
jgi:hypothetical protein